MTAIVKRITKGTILTVAELDANVANLNSTKLETTGGTLTGLPVLANQDVDIISPVYPTIKPSLNLDFTRGQLDPRVTFARNSMAAYYDGKSVAKAEENLLTYSQNILGGSYTNITASPNYTSAPDGTLTATALYETIDSSTQKASSFGNTGSTAGTYTFSIYLKKGDGVTAPDWIQFGFGGGFFGYANFNLTTGTIGNYSGGGAGGMSVPIITPVSSSWYRCVVTISGIPSATSFNVCFVNNTNVSTRFATTAYAGSLTTNCYVWGAQLEQRSSVTAYTPTTTAPITNYIPVMKFAPANVPRFDYDPITGKPLGLLIEEGRTNYLVGSNTPTTQPVGASPPTVTTESIVLPDGTIGMCSKVLFASSGDTRVRVPAYGTWSGNYYFSVFYKVSGDLGWKRYSGSAGIAASLLYFDIGSSGLDGSSWYGKTVYFTFGQLEAGSFATSYIPTTAGSVGRFADVASMSGTNFSSWYNQNEGSFYCEARQYDSINKYAGIFAVRGSSNNIFLWKNITNLYYSYNYPSPTNVLVNTNINPLSNLFKASITYSNLGGTVGVNGGVVSSSVPIIQPAITLIYPILQIGYFDATTMLSGHIRKLTYYPKALSSTELQALTS